MNKTNEKGAKGTPGPREKPTSAEVEPDLYNAVVEAAELNSIALVSSDFEIKPTYFRDKKKNHHSISGDLDEVSFSEEDGFAVGFYNWSIIVKSGREHVFKLKTRFMILYTSLDGHDPDCVILFMKKMIRFSTYPYFRNYVSTISWLSDADLPIMPVISTLPHRKQSKPRQKRGPRG